MRENYKAARYASFPIGLIVITGGNTFTNLSISECIGSDSNYVKDNSKAEDLRFFFFN